MTKTPQTAPDDRSASAAKTAAAKGELFDPGEIHTKTDSILDRAVRPIGWLVLVVAAISTYEVFARYALNRPTQWVHETSTFLIAVVFLVGGVRALARNQHVQINLLQLILPKRAGVALQLVNRAILLVVCLALLAISADMAWQATHVRAGAPYAFERSGTGWNPPFPAIVKITLFVTCLLLSVQAAAQLRHRLRLVRAGTEPGATDTGRGKDDDPV